MGPEITEEEGTYMYQLQTKIKLYLDFLWEITELVPEKANCDVI